MKRAQKKRAVDPKTLPPIRIKKCPPTIEEAIIAAQGLVDEVEAQVEIAAGFMGVEADEVRAQVIRAFEEAKSVETLVVADRRGSERAVIVERARTRSPVTVERSRPAVVVERTRPRIQLAPRVRTFDLTRRPAG